MDLKEFITETMNGIIEATNELQDKWVDEGVIVNPPVDIHQSPSFEEDSPGHIYRQIQNVEFDVAVTVGAETAGEGKAGLKVFSAELGVKGEHTRRNEEVSRVQFTIPLTLRASGAEHTNRLRRQERDAKDDATMRNRRGPFVV